MRHYLYTRAVALSSAFMLLAIIFWIRGYFAYDHTGWHRIDWTADYQLNCTHYAIGSGSGQFSLRLTQCNQDWSSALRPDRWQALTPSGRRNVANFRTDNPQLASWLTFTSPASDFSGTDLLKQSLIGFDKVYCEDHTQGFYVLFPAWLIVALSAILPLHWFERRYRPRKSPPPAQELPITPCLA